jgi:diguanylate cyclase (GGDEF)-like protein
LAFAYCSSLFFWGIGLAFRFVRSYRLVSCIAVGGVILTEVLLVEIFARIDNGMLLGVGGYMFYCMVPMVGFLGLTLRFAIPYSMACVALPHLLATLGFVSDFPHVQYAVLMWPATVMTLLGYFATTLNYRRRYESEQALQRASDTDPMTGVANRRAFMPLLDQEAARHACSGMSFSLVMIDIDHFKSVNDTHGHRTGDRVICKLAEICSQVAQQSETVARLGGEEFAILLPKTDLVTATSFAERLRMLIEELTMTSEEGVEFRITVSMGVAGYCGEGASVERLMSAADRGLYHAKYSGRNRVFTLDCA